MAHKAELWKKLDNSAVKCKLCGHGCVIQKGKYGICRVRQNVDGELYSLNYGKLIAANVDPIEKKPLYHFQPGSMSYSIASAGCNFRCPFCQNWQISQVDLSQANCPGTDASPKQIVQAALDQNCRSISYTYTEPTIYFELAHETAIIAHEHNLKNVFVSNGYMTPLAVKTISPYLDAINVDLKAFRKETYRQIMKAELSEVLKCLVALVAEGVWVEVTTLVVPGMNDSDQELTDIAEFIYGKLGSNVPWHISRFHGDYQMVNKPSTPLETMIRAVSAGRDAGLKYIYCGNIPGQLNSNTNCPQCGKMLIEREGFRVLQENIFTGQCPECNYSIAGVWD